MKKQKFQITYCETFEQARLYHSRMLDFIVETIKTKNMYLHDYANMFEYKGTISYCHILFCNQTQKILFVTSLKNNNVLDKILNRNTRIYLQKFC